MSTSNKDRESVWFEKTELSRLQRCACSVLKAGPVPRHIAFIMDGNRRYARKLGLGSVLDGHAKGFEQLGLALKWCRDFGVQYVTVYAFSLENFKRKVDEVEGLMRLAREKFVELLQERKQMEEYGVKFRFFGDLTQLPSDLQQLIAEVELETENYSKANVNVCLAYTAQDEMTRSVRTIMSGVEEKFLLPSDINDYVIDRCLDSGDCPDPDLLIRTSGEMRMSDFLLWQSSYSCLYFDKVLWPEFSFWHLCWAILYYQRYRDRIHACQRRHNEVELSLPPDAMERVQTFLDVQTARKRAHRMKLDEQRKTDEIIHSKID